MIKRNFEYYKIKIYFLSLFSLILYNLEVKIPLVKLVFFKNISITFKLYQIYKSYVLSLHTRMNYPKFIKICSILRVSQHVLQVLE